VLSDSSNVLVHLAPAPVVARVATTLALIRPDPAAALAREVSVAGWLAGRGAPVVAPSDELPPGPHSEGGFDLTFWRLVEPLAGVVPELGAVARGLADLHRELRDYPGDLPYLRPAFAEVESGLDFVAATGRFAPEELEPLRAAHARLVPELESWPSRIQSLHGDAHPGNVLITSAGMLWSDFEDVCRGPVHWDLACLTRASVWADDALELYDDAPPPEELAPFLEARNLQGTMWLAVMAERFPERREEAARRLRGWRDRA
jgi:Ser/Thr protein kinase RdoA (MazF antagonist)